MSTPKIRVPRYCLHKSDGQAVCFVNRRTVYLGVYGSPESYRRHREVIAQLTGQTMEQEPVVTTDKREVPKSIGEVCLQFCRVKLPEYSKDEQRCQKLAIGILVDLFAEIAAKDFNPLDLRAVRQRMVEQGWSRSFCNKQTARIKHIFSWAVGWNFVPVSVPDSLKHVESLSPGQTDAPESRPRSAISEERLTAVRNELNGRTRDLWDIMLLSGCRPGELLGLKMGQLDRSGEIWKCELAQHKTSRKGKRRVLFFNRSCQELMAKYLKADPDARLFPLRVDSFSAAIRSACEVAFGMPIELRKPGKDLSPAQRADVKRRAIAWRREHAFSAHWLRHCVATRLTDEMGLEAAQRLLGHCSAAMTRHYSTAADRQAIEAAKKLG